MTNKSFYLALAIVAFHVLAGVLTLIGLSQGCVEAMPVARVILEQSRVVFWLFKGGGPALLVVGLLCLERHFPGVIRGLLVLVLLMSMFDFAWDLHIVL